MAGSLQATAAPGCLPLTACACVLWQPDLTVKGVLEPMGPTKQSYA